MTRSKLLLILVIVVIVGAFLGFDGHKLLTLENLQANQDALAQWIDQNLLMAVAGYALGHIYLAGSGPRRAE